MATPGTYSNPAYHIHDLNDPRLELAYEEGHDADIPSNLGVYTPGQRSSIHDHEKGDLEKGAISHPTTSSGEVDDGADTTEKLEGAEESDPNVVFWDGPDDPENPMNWPNSLKWGNIAILSSITFVTPLASSMFAPGVPEVMAGFHEKSDLLAAFVVSVFLLGFAFGPLIVAPLSELYGRRWIYHSCNILFIIFTIACGVSSNFNMLVGFRFLQGSVGSAPLTIGGGTIADLMPVEKRGGAMAIWAMGPLIGPVVGPVVGGFLVQAKGWRWVFYLIAILGGTVTILAFVFMRESYAPVILERRAAKLRKETGNPNLRSKLTSPISPKELFRLSIVRPTKMLLTSPIVFCMSFYSAVAYGILYLLFTTITFVFEEKYHFSSGTVGLTYIATGIGMIIGLAVLGVLSDRVLKNQKAKGKALKPEDRLPMMLTVPGGICLPVGLFIYGWGTDKHVHWIVPLIGTSFVGIGMLSNFLTIQTYLVDAFTLHAASAMAANTVIRSIFGAILPLAGLSMYNKLGLGWGNSLLGFVALGLIPVPVIFKIYGERIRTNPRFQLKL
ncbi:MFS general substrate transporter [Mytilinidion resinicola]|uniref:MFS general substrate transporter n=1 Tax=Mytilinidion resinicola TaxID=574789 RepID=A0A6A6YN22_9PEZI|nr:MFS general substrate transporter [Mytilinidion resinicola]KAF2810286.1 MFS general substrate transporter [Mytilinidion resinicola]